MTRGSVLISHRVVVVVRIKLYTALLAAPPTRCAYSASTEATSLPNDTNNRQSRTRLVQTNPNRDICAVSRFHRAFAVPSTMPLRAATAHMLALSSAPPSVSDDPSYPGSARALKGRHLTTRSSTRLNNKRRSSVGGSLFTMVPLHACYPLLYEDDY